MTKLPLIIEALQCIAIMVLAAPSLSGRTAITAFVCAIVALILALVAWH